MKIFYKHLKSFNLFLQKNLGILNEAISCWFYDHEMNFPFLGCMWEPENIIIVRCDFSL